MAKANKSSDVGVDELEESYKRKIDLALQRQGIRGKAREKLVRWREEGVREMRPKPENLPWLQEQVWKSLYRSLRVATVFAVCDIDKYPNAVSELYTEIRRLMESFRGRPTKVEISGVLAETASRLVHKYRYTLIGLGPSIWLRVFIQISDPALETRLDFSGSP